MFRDKPTQQTAPSSIPAPAPKQDRDTSLDELLDAKVKIDNAIRAKAELQMGEQLQKVQALASAMGCTVATLLGIQTHQSQVQPTERKKRQAKPKYRDPQSGEEWSGRGRPPAWMQAQIDQGRAKEEFLIEQPVELN